MNSDTKSFLSIKSWSVDDRPHEKLRDKGSSVLSDVELIAILIGSGTKNKSAVDLAKLAFAIILAHNHPLGNLNPGQSDIKITKSLIEAGKILEISVLDHIIIARKEYTSFADEDLL
tara:strand:- start:1270 stop:1620 length:351 start_codon:yes stop_codon:yes gene_type:complete